ncbi:MAG: DUF2088 domain-containing protein [Pirellulales bacterium]|nr:DUF2088 domain-containing protein [Pirellulales bacterium]
MLIPNPSLMSAFPQIFRIRQTFAAPRVDDVPGEVRRQLARLALAEKIRPAQRVAVTAGSRGIAQIALILRTVVEHLRGLGAEPFLVPAMGSHGGGTAEGQRRLLERYGIAESAVGCPIRSSLETVVIGRTAGGMPVHFDRWAFEADHVLVCNRVKPHSTIQGDIESGLLKMLLMGLGKCAGATIYHRAVQEHDFARLLDDVVPLLLEKCPLRAGLAIVENAADQTALVEALRPEEFLRREKELLVLARQWLPRLPFDRADLLLVDRIGKDVSGVGLDPNVVGRKFNDHRAVEHEFPKIKRIAVRGLTPAAQGNAVGMGLAEFCRTQLLRETDLQATRLNVLTSGRISAAMPPLDYETDREMLSTALGTIGLSEPPDARLLWIADTLHLTEVECSTAYLAAAQARSDLEILSPPRNLPFDAAGNLPESVS